VEFSGIEDWHIVGARGLWRDSDRRLSMFKFASSVHVHDAARTSSLALRVSQSVDVQSMPYFLFFDGFLFSFSAHHTEFRLYQVCDLAAQLSAIGDSECRYEACRLYTL
jgi:hypothetical protein